MEMHLVHRSSNGQLAVVGVLIKEGQASEELAKAWAHLPSEVGENEYPDVELEIDHALPEDRRAYHYAGSLTTPPCSEGVRWIVLDEPIEMSREQITAFREALEASCCSANSRPAQSLNERQFGLDIN